MKEYTKYRCPIITWNRLKGINSWSDSTIDAIDSIHLNFDKPRTWSKINNNHTLTKISIDNNKWTRDEPIVEFRGLETNEHEDHKASCLEAIEKKGNKEEKRRGKMTM